MGLADLPYSVALHFQSLGGLTFSKGTLEKTRNKKAHGEMGFLSGF